MWSSRPGPRSTPSARRGAVVALTGAFAVTLAACGSSGTTAVDATPISQAASPSAAGASATPATSATATTAPATSAAPSDSPITSESPSLADSTSPSAAESPPPSPSPSPSGPTLPDGSRVVFPMHRVVAIYGTPTGGIKRDILDRLTPASAVEKVKEQAKAYSASTKPVLPAFEVIAQIANGSPGADGLYATFYDDDQISKWVDAATKAGLLVVLDLQPGQGDFLSGAKHLQKFLEKPNVGLALDAEWHMAKGEVPGTVIGTVTAGQVNEVSSWLADLVTKNNLPQKILVVHEFVDSAVIGRKDITLHPDQLASVIHIDGFGGQTVKKEKYAALHTERRGEYNGFKLFYQDDVGLFQPSDILGFKPTPDLITYQ